MPSALQRAGTTYVSSDLNTLTSLELAEIRRDYPMLRDDYLSYMQSVGWGETESGKMIYQGPTAASDIYGARIGFAEIVLLGDDFQGYCFGFNKRSGHYGEVSEEGRWQEWPITQGIDYYVAESDKT